MNKFVLQRFRNKRNIICFSFLIIAAFVCTSLVSGDDILCYKCSNIALPHVCDTITQCGHHEVCYVERYVSSTGVTYYESGCRTNTTCGHGDKVRTKFPDCRECCTGNFCNKDLCTSEPVKNMHRCLKCNSVRSPMDCNKVTACSDDELCHTQETEQFGYTLYTLGCLQERACSAEPIFGRRKSITLRSERCHQCCHGENCNRNLCYNAGLRQTTTHFATTNLLQTTTSYTTSRSSTTATSMHPTTSTIFRPTTSSLHTTTPATSHLRDCLEIYKSNVRTNGLYNISIDNITQLLVYCDMSNGGWTLIQRRISDSVNFTRGWNDYVNGFGDLSGNFWLGLKYIHQLTSPAVDILLEVVTKDTHETATMKYGNFYIDGPGDNYTMHINPNGTYNNVAQNRKYDRLNGFGYHDNGQFGTYDHPDKNNCVGLYRSGFWYTSCWVVNLNQPFEQMDVNGNYGNGKVERSEIKIKRSR